MINTYLVLIEDMSFKLKNRAIFTTLEEASKFASVELHGLYSAKEFATAVEEFGAISFQHSGINRNVTVVQE